MIMLSKSISLETSIENPRVIVVTDRISLDKQIYGTFKNCGKKAQKAKSGNDLIDLLKDKLSCIFYLIDKYKQKNDSQLLTFVSLLIELFYNDLSIKNNKNLGLYFVNKFKLLKQIDDAKKFNLDKKNLLISIKGTLEHESK